MNDLKFALRQLLKHPGFTAVAVLTLPGMGHRIMSRFTGWSRVTALAGVALLGAVSPDVHQASAQISTNDSGTLPSARQILDRYVEAIGGRERWLKLKSIHLTGRFESVELGFSGPLELWATVPNKRVVQIDLERYGRVLQGFDGKNGWVLEPQQEMQRLAGTNLDRMREEADLRAPLHEPELFSLMVSSGRTNFVERPAYELRLVTKAGQACSKYFDVETGLLLGMVTRDAAPATTIYRDYREFAGLRIPSFEEKAIGGFVRQRITLASADFASIENSRFDYRRYEPRLDRSLFPVIRKNGAGQPDASDEIVLREMRRAGIPGLALAVLRNGELLKAEGYGFADIEAATPVTPHTRFQLCSVTKPFTALGVALLAQGGQLRLDDSVALHLPDLPKAASGITIRQLLSHTAGLAREPYSWNSLPDYSEATVLDAIFRVPSGLQPRERMLYSNGGYQLLGILIHRITNESWNQWMARRLFQPLGMTETSSLFDASALPERAFGYVSTPQGGWERGFRDPPAIVGAAGGLVSSILDLAKFETALSNGAILPSPALKELWTPASLKDGNAAGYGLGWSLFLRDGHEVVEHTGGNIEGIRTVISRFVNDRLTVVLLCNWAKANAQELAHRIADAYLETGNDSSKQKSKRLIP